MKTMRDLFIQLTIAIAVTAFALGQDSGDTRTGHAGEVVAIAISPDSKMIASGGKDGTLRIWNAASGRETAKILGPVPDEADSTGDAPAVNCVAFSPDGKLLAAAFDNGVSVWTVGDWTAAPKAGIPNSNIAFLAFSPDSTKLAMAERQPSGFLIGIPGMETTPHVEIWDIEAGEASDTLNGGYGPIAFHPNGEMLVFTNEEGLLFFQDLVSKDDARGTKLKSDDERVATLVFNKTGDHLYSLAGGGMMSEGGVRVWRTADRKLASKYNVGSDDLILAHPNGKDIVIAGGMFSQSSLSVVNPMTGVTVGSVSRSDANVGAPAAISSDGKLVAAMDKNGHDIQVIDLTASKIKATLKGHTIFVNSLAFSADDKSLVTGYYDGSLIAWDHNTGKVLKIVKTEKQPETNVPIFFQAGEENGTVVLSPDAKRYVIGSAANKIYDSASGKMITKIAEPTAGVNISFTANAGLVAVSENRTVRISDTSTGKLVKKFPVIGDRDLTPTTTAFSPDGKQIAICGAALSLRDVTTGVVKRSFAGSRGCAGSLAITSDGKHLVSGAAKGIAVYSLVTGRLVYLHREKGSTFALSPDGRSLAIVLYDGLELCDLVGGKQIFSNESSIKMSLANVYITFSHDGKLIAVGTDMGAQIFNAADGKPVLTLQ